VSKRGEWRKDTHGVNGVFLCGEMEVVEVGWWVECSDEKGTVVFIDGCIVGGEDDNTAMAGEG
jgi:hypothetical protein